MFFTVCWNTIPLAIPSRVYAGPVAVPRGSPRHCSCSASPSLRTPSGACSIRWAIRCVSITSRSPPAPAPIATCSSNISSLAGGVYIVVEGVLGSPVPAPFLQLGQPDSPSAQELLPLLLFFIFPAMCNSKARSSSLIRATACLIFPNMRAPFP